MRIAGELALAILLVAIVYLLVKAIIQLRARPKAHQRHLVVDSRHLESGYTEIFVASRDELSTAPDIIKWTREVDSNDDIELNIALEDARSFRRNFERR